MNNPEKVLVALKGSTSQMFVEKLMPKAKLALADDYGQAVAMVKMTRRWPWWRLSDLLGIVYRYPDGVCHAE